MKALQNDSTTLPLRIRTLLKKVWFGSILLINASLTNGQTIYVNGGADESGDGSISAPYRTIGTAIILHCPDDARMLVARGSYPENLVIDIPLVVEASGGPVVIGSSEVVVTYSSYPLITGSGITDIHEGRGIGPEGFAYFRSAPREKAGNLPRCVGGETGWDTDVWASNFQGPIKVTPLLVRWCSASFPSFCGLARIQWEWTADGSLQTTEREYPAYYGVINATRLSDLQAKAYDIYEDDECFLWICNSDDYVGTITIDHGYCKTEVFDMGLTSGWTSEHRNTRRGGPSGSGDVEYVAYKLFCSRAAIDL